MKPRWDPDFHIFNKQPGKKHVCSMSVYPTVSNKRLVGSNMGDLEYMSHRTYWRSHARIDD